MKKSSAFLLAAVLVCSAFAATPAQAEDTIVQKTGKAIVWPFKKIGQGLKAMGNGAKKLVGKGK